MSESERRGRRAVVAVSLDHTGAPLIEDDGARKKIGELAARRAGFDPPELPIIIYVKQGDAQMGRIEVAHNRQKQAIIEALDRHDGVDTIEFPIGEADEPTLAEIKSGIEAASDLGLSVRLQLPQ